ncbi:hypothetical protein BKA93DRAFT_752712 [Sparassis latifolia]
MDMLRKICDHPNLNTNSKLANLMALGICRRVTAKLLPGRLYLWELKELLLERGIIVDEPKALRWWRTKNIEKRKIGHGPPDTGAEMWVQSLGGKNIYEMKLFRREELGDHGRYEKMAEDAKYFVFEEPASTDHLVYINMRWLCVQFDYAAETNSEYCGLGKCPAIFLTSYDPRDGNKDRRDILDHMFDFIRIPEKIYRYDDKLAAQQEKEQEQKKEREQKKKQESHED